MSTFDRAATGATDDLRASSNEGDHRALSLWQAYSRLVERYLVLLEFTDDAISRLLFFSPLSSKEQGASRWREVIWGLLQLHRLTIDMALRQRRHLPIEINDFGTTISIQNSEVPSKSVRIALTVLQGLGPTLQEIMRATTRSDVILRRRQLQTKSMIERLRFILRLYLLTNYWKEFWRERSSFRKKGWKTLLPGLLMQGGMFPIHSFPPTILQEKARIEREHYVGRRSGRMLRESRCQGPLTHGWFSSSVQQTSQLLLGEILYIIRPMYQAEAELRNDGKPSKLLRSWVNCLVMDTIALWNLRSATREGNHSTKGEWKRRRLRLLLYMLRAPIWEEVTQPTVARMGKLLDRMPIFGRLVSNYVWEWLFYWRLYRAEEG